MYIWPHIMPYRVVSFRTASYHIISHPTIPYHTIPYHTFSYQIISYHIMSYHIISYHAISYHIISLHIIPYHDMSYHNIPCHIIAFHERACPVISHHIVSYHFMSFSAYIHICTCIRLRRKHPMPQKSLAATRQSPGHESTGHCTGRLNNMPQCIIASNVPPSVPPPSQKKDRIGLNKALLGPSFGIGVLSEFVSYKPMNVYPSLTAFM